jgi:hypothetical protein
VGIPSMVGFMAFTKPSAITEPLNEFFFHIMEFRLSRSPSRIFFHTMEFRLSRSPS